VESFFSQPQHVPNFLVSPQRSTPAETETLFAST
jgi:hypothetical protein